MRHTRKAAVSPSPKTLINRRGSEGRGFESCRGDRARDSPDSSLLSPQVSRMGRLDHVTASFLNSPYRPSKPLVVARRVGRCLLNFKPIPSIVISVQGNEKVVVTLWHSRPLVHFAAHAQERAWNSIRRTGHKFLVFATSFTEEICVSSLSRAINASSVQVSLISAEAQQLMCFSRSPGHNIG